MDEMKNTVGQDPCDDNSSLPAEEQPGAEEKTAESDSPADAQNSADVSDSAETEGTEPQKTDADGETASDGEQTAPVFVAEENSTAEEPADGKKKKKKGGKKLVIALLAVTLAVIVAGLCAVVWVTQGGTVGSVKSDETIMTIDDEKFSAGELYFYYLNYYSYYYQYIQYGSISEDSLKDGAIKEMAYVTTVYNKATAEGVKLSDSEYKTYVTDSLDSIASQAEKDGMTTDDYLEKYYGKGFNSETLTKILEKNALAAVYKERKSTEAQDYYKTDAGVAEIIKEYNENRSDYDLAGIEYYYFTDDENGDTAAQKAEKLIGMVNGGQTFANAIYDNFKGEDYKYARNECPQISNASYDTLSKLSNDVAAWVFEIDSNGNYLRNAGDMKAFEANSMTYVIRVNSVPAKVETCPVTYRDIFISASGTDEEAMMQAKSEATKLYNDYKSHAQESGYDADYFGTLAGNNSDDSATSSNGGLHEGVYLSDSECDKWALQGDRKQGDCALVKADDGYHVVLFDSKSDSPQWMNEITDALAQEKVNSMFTDAENASANAVKDDALIEKVIASAQKSFAALTEAAQAQNDSQDKDE